MSPWNDIDPWLHNDGLAYPSGEPEPDWLRTALALIIALLLAWLAISGQFDPAPGATAVAAPATATPDADPPLLMYDVRLALDQMSRQV